MASSPPPGPSEGPGGHPSATSAVRDWRSRLWTPCALLSGAGFVLSPEAGLGAGVAVLVVVFLFSPHRERDGGLLLGVLGLGILATARSVYPGLGMILAGGYLLARARRGLSAGGERGGKARAGERRRGPGVTDSLLGNRTLYELATALGAVALVVALLQQGTATWPAMVAVESCSMEPNIGVGDLVLVVGPSRSAVVTQEGERVEFVGPGRTPIVTRLAPSAGGTTPPRETGPPVPNATPLAGGSAAEGGGDGGRTARESGEGLRSERPALPLHRAFALTSGCVADREDRRGCGARGEPLAGDVVVFYPNGNPACTPIIHRARAWVPDGGSYGGRGFAQGGLVTKGDNNGPPAGADPSRAVDQMAGGGTSLCPNTLPVRPEWLVGTAQFRIPWLGYVRLLFGNWPRSCATGL